VFLLIITDVISDKVFRVMVSDIAIGRS
jgi:hypothetical protein